MQIDIPLVIFVPKEYTAKKFKQTYFVYVEDAQKLEKFINALAEQENPQLQWNYLELGNAAGGIGKEFVEKCLKPLSGSFHEVAFNVKKKPA